MENRTLQDFVEDMVSDCRSLDEILLIAANTRWKDRKDEIKKVYVLWIENQPTNKKFLRKVKDEQETRIGNNHKEQSH